MPHQTPPNPTHPHHSAPQGAPVKPPRRGDPSRVVAVLGPTNTGKTHLAVERMIAHPTGVIGLPLRLLAREIYDRIAKQKGPGTVALVTGEEKIIPSHARWWVATVEAMPLDRSFDFLAVDEIQLCADPERGHVFTERLLNARGRYETMFLGADSMRGLIRNLVPETEFVTRPRFSDLAYVGLAKLSRLPRRSAIVAFSANDVYAIAELVRRQRGGAAVVMGALSPRTRNAQVALYQSGEVDFLVATDAIGMGLNMDVDHVAFAGTRKFDGHAHRPLRAPEVAQIAGRAGRYSNDGTFGVTGEEGGLEEEIVEAVENHRFDPVKALQWRSSALDFRTIPGLIASLEQVPGVKGLVRAREADDLIALKRLAKDNDVNAKIFGPEDIRRLWDVCVIPDFRKTMAEEHAHFLTRVFLHLSEGNGRLPEDWIEQQVSRLNGTEGDIDALSHRLTHVRTWTYIAHHAQWLNDARHWQERTRAIEDALSDALHERLTQRFVDRRTAALMRRLRDNESLDAQINEAGEIQVEGEFLGRLRGFRFVADPRSRDANARAFRAAADKVLAVEVRKRADQLVADEDAKFELSEHGQIWWQGAAVGRLLKGRDPLHPRVEPLTGELVVAADSARIRERLEQMIARRIDQELGPLRAIAGEESLPGLARGLAFELIENLGTVSRALLTDMVRALSPDERKALRQHNVRLGELSVYQARTLRPAAARLRVTLWAVYRGIANPPPAPAPGLTSFSVEAPMPPGFLEAAGFRQIGSRAIRADILERLADLVRPLAEKGPFTAGLEMLSILGCGTEDLARVLKALGYRQETVTDGEGATTILWHRKGPGRRRPERVMSAAPQELPSAAPSQESADGVQSAPAEKQGDPRKRRRRRRKPAAAQTVVATGSPEAVSTSTGTDEATSAIAATDDPSAAPAKKRRPRRRRKPAPEGANRHPRETAQGADQVQAAPPKPPRQRNEKNFTKGPRRDRPPPPPREPAFDPNSPFAILARLKRT